MPQYMDHRNADGDFRKIISSKNYYAKHFPEFAVAKLKRKYKQMSRILRGCKLYIIVAPYLLAIKKKNSQLFCIKTFCHPRGSLIEITGFLEFINEVKTFRIPYVKSISPYGQLCKTNLFSELSLPKSVLRSLLGFAFCINIKM